MTGIDAARTRDVAFTLSVAAAGGFAFHALGLPAPFLTGSASAVTVASLGGLRARIPFPLRDACFLALGIGIGSVVTPEVLGTALEWPLSFAVLGITLAVCMMLGRIMLQRVFRFDAASAALAATPGHLSFVLGLAADSGADLSRVAIVQSIRVLFLTLVVPPLVLAGFERGDALPGATGTMTVAAIAGAGVLAYITGRLFIRLRLPAAFLLAGMAVSAGLHLSGFAQGSLPGWVSLPAFAVMGALIGTRFAGQSLEELRRNLAAGLAITILLVTLSGIGAVFAMALVGQPGGALLIAFAPGGVEAMSAIAVQMELSPTFVAAHHVARLFMLTFLIPVFRLRQS